LDNAVLDARRKRDHGNPPQVEIFKEIREEVMLKD